MRYHWIHVAVLLLMMAGCAANQVATPSQAPTKTSLTPETQTGTTIKRSAVSSSGIIFPIDRALERVTKKTFGLKVSPGHSPISPERFIGYHTGVDFETFPEEQNIGVVIRAICTGPIVLKKWATGYGGVVVEQCQLEKQEVTVVYGHLNIDSIDVSIGSIVQTGSELGFLGKGFSTETDGERKHLHLGIHKGTKVDVRGYVATSSELNQWIDLMSYLK